MDFNLILTFVIIHLGVFPFLKEFLSIPLFEIG